MQRIWTETFKARFYEVGPDGSITIQALSNYFQEAASNHAAELGVGMHQLLEKGQSWMLSRYFIEIYQFPQWKDPVSIDTWPAGNERMFAMRLFRLRCGDIEIGFGSSAWLLIDLARRRPLRPDFVRDFDEPGPPIKLAQKLPAKVEPPADFSHERLFHVRTSDLDINQHVNNAAYIDWALEAVPPEVRRERCLQSLQVDFLSECREGEQVVSKCLAGGADCWRHGIFRQDGGLAAAAMSCWGK
jgi:acyl-ACP thioesterase